MTYLTRKFPFARAEWTEDGVEWIAEAVSGTGTWVIRGEPDSSGREGQLALRGLMVPFPHADSEQPTGGMLLVLSPATRAELGMSDRTYHELNLALRMPQG